jgi:hypothetical protein
MARTTHTVYQCLGSYPLVAADAFEKAGVAADASNFEEVAFTGREIVIAFNSGATGRLVTIESVADERNRTGDLTETVGAGNFAIFGPLEVRGFKQSNGMLNFRAAHAEVKFIVLRLP